MFGPRARNIIDTLAGQSPGIAESVDVCNVTGWQCDNEDLLTEIRTLAGEATQEHMAIIELRSALDVEFPLQHVTLQQVTGQNLTLRIAKESTAEWVYFLTRGGLADSLEDLTGNENPRSVWIPETFEPFTTHTLRFGPWGGPREHNRPAGATERPRKLVRDQTYERTPEFISPWLLDKEPADNSHIFGVWRKAAVRRLAFVLPYEIRAEGGAQYAILKGPRSNPIAISPIDDNWADANFTLLNEAVQWVYGSRQHAEERFIFLNEQLSLAWRDNDRWSPGLRQVLSRSLVSAKDAYEFYLRDQSKETLRSLGDLRKSLMDEVAKTQQATRDLLSAIWRDFAIAALVLALRSPAISSTTIHPEVLRIVTLAAATLLFISLLVTQIGRASCRERV